MRVKQSNAFKGLPQEAIDIISLLRKNKAYIKSKFHVKKLAFLVHSFKVIESASSQSVER